MGYSPQCLKESNKTEAIYHALKHTPFLSTNEQSKIEMKNTIHNKDKYMIYFGCKYAERFAKPIQPK